MGSVDRSACPALRSSRDWLNEGQKRAVKHILSSRDRVILVKGSAGTGKTTLMQEAVEGIGEGGRGVVALAPSAVASRDVLRREGFAGADTIAAFLRSKDMQHRAKGNIIWVDEAGLVNNRDMTALFDVAKRLDCRIVLMGDTSQHSSPACGTPLKLLEQFAGVLSVAVTEIVRQKEHYLKTVKLLSEGKTDQALNELDRLGWLREVPDTERYLRLAEAYLDASSQRKADGSFKTALVVCPTHAERELVTDAIRQELTAKKRLGEEKEFQVWLPRHLTEAERGQADSYSAGDMLLFHQNAKGGYQNGQRVVVDGNPLPLDLAGRFQVYRPTMLRIAVGDRLRITSNGKTLDGHRLNNGATYTVKEFRDGDIVLDNGWLVAKEFGHIDFAYSITSHASQSKTVDRVIIGQSELSYPASDRSQLYVSVSRGREQAIIFTDDKKALRDAVNRDRERPTATEIFRPRRPWGRERLKRHLSFLRRLASFVRPRANVSHDQNPIQKEKIHER